MELWASFDLASLLVGLLVGAISAFLLRLQSLKKLSLDIKKIGLGLGVEGFEEKQSGFQIGGDVTGDVAGRDMDKSQNYNKSSRDAYNIFQALADSGRIKIRRNESMQAEDLDPIFILHLEAIAKDKSRDWTRKWIDSCLENPRIKNQIDAKIREITDKGWQVREIDFDNHGLGIHVNFTTERNY